MRTKHWSFLVAGLFLFSLLLLLPRLFGSKGTIAEIYQDGNLIQSVDLSKVSDSYTIPVVTETGENIIQVESGSISVLSATCPDQVCVRQGKIHDGMVPIVCLPHKLVIEIKNKNSGPDLISH